MFDWVLNTSLNYVCYLKPSNLTSYPANISCFSRRPENFFNIKIFIFQRRLPKTFSMCLQDVFFKTSPKPFQRRLSLADVLDDKKNVTLKTSSTRLRQDECLRGTGMLLTELIYTKSLEKFGIKLTF